jgi:hypothetical protein
MTEKISVVQVWCDPKHPTAHRDPALRAWLNERGKEGVACLVRYDSTRAMALIPPSMSDDHQWHEIITDLDPTLREQHGYEPSPDSNAGPDSPVTA